MPYMTDTGRIGAFVNYMFANAAAPSGRTSPFHLRLMTAMGAGNGNVSGSNGTELSASGYTALGSTMGADPTFTTFNTTTPVAISNSSAVSWSATGTWSTVVGIEIWGTEATPLRYLQGTVTSSITGVVNGDTVQFAVGSITGNPVQW